MNRDQKKDQRRNKRIAAKRREIEKSRIEDVDPDDDFLVQNELEATGEHVEKDMFSNDVYATAEPMMQPAGPTSFQELDDIRSAQEQAQAAMEVTWDTQSLVRNILNHPEMDDQEKADAITAVADEFPSRITTEVATKENDLEVLQLESIVSKERRSMSALEQIEDVSKRVVSYASESKMPDDNFALVVDRNGKKVRKYLIHDKAHVRNALARAAQMIKRGGQSASDARAALPKIHSAAKKMGIGSNMEKERNAILVQKDAKDQWRWVGWVSNNYIDWDGDIFSEDAHKEYVEWLEKNMDCAPAFVSWHTPGTARKSPVDFAMYENGFLIMSGPLEDQEAECLLKVQSQVDIGMSHGTFIFDRDPKDPRVVTKYRMYEASDLILSKAANPFTDFETVTKEVTMDKKEYLAQILGSPEKAEAFLAKTGLKQKALDEAGIAKKEEKPKESTPAAAPVDPPAPAPASAAAPEPAKAMTTEEIVAQVMKEMDVDGLNAFVLQAKEAMEKVPVLEGVIKELQGNAEDKLAEKLTPPASRFAWAQANRPSADDKNIVDQKEKEKSAPGVPEDYWLSNITKTAPVKVE